MLRISDASCVVYLPTFGWFLLMLNVGKYTNPVDQWRPKNVDCLSLFRSLVVEIPSFTRFLAPSKRWFGFGIVEPSTVSDIRLVVYPIIYRIIWFLFCLFWLQSNLSWHMSVQSGPRIQLYLELPRINGPKVNGFHWGYNPTYRGYNSIHNW